MVDDLVLEVWGVLVLESGFWDQKIVRSRRMKYSISYLAEGVLVPGVVLEEPVECPQVSLLRGHGIML